MDEKCPRNFWHMNVRCEFLHSHLLRRLCARALSAQSHCGRRFETARARTDVLVDDETLETRYHCWYFRAVD